MGLFNWLFGKKPKPDSYSRDYNARPRNPKQIAGTPQVGDGNWPAETSGFRPGQRHDSRAHASLFRINPQTGEPLSHEKRGKSHRSVKWRIRRSKKPLGLLKSVQDEWLAKKLEEFGGTLEAPARGGDPERAKQLGIESVPHADALAALLELQRGELLFWVIRRQYYDDYVLRRIPKKSGGFRLLMMPMPRLKAVQRRLYQSLITKLPLNECVHGFRIGRSVLTNASVHVCKPVVICMDIKDFFPSFDLRRVCGYFRWLGYSRGISLSLASLTTASCSQSTLVQSAGKKGFVHDFDLQRNTVHEAAETLPPGHASSLPYMRPVLPQGAPTSPGIANAIVWRMDKRLTALARKFGGDYTRYADDLTFSGFEKMAKHAKLIVALVEKIVHTEGLAINKKKTRIMRKGRQQRVTGVVVNKQTNLSRRDFDLLKAILHNCIKKGPSTQNRSNHPNFKEHLRGRVAHALHIGPERGAKLKKLFDAIDWSR